MAAKASASATASAPDSYNQTTERNEVLKLKFRGLHMTVVNNVNPASVIDFLFQQHVLGCHDYKALNRIKDDPEQQCKDLLVLLHTSEHPEAFIHLYAAIKEESQLHWLVDRIDQFTDQPLTSLLQQQQQQQQKQHQYISEPTALKSRFPTLTHVIPRQGRRNVYAVTSLGDKVFVVRYNSHQVEVYDAETFTLQRHITVPGLGTWPVGLAACAVNHCIYASDWNSIHRVELSGSNAVKKWSVAGGPEGLSVNKAHNLVVVCCGENKLHEYTTHGFLVREICLPVQAGVTNPWHAIQLSTGHYVVSQCKSPGVVSVVGVDGQVIHSYGQSQTSDVGQMNHPSSLAVTKNDDILVADEDNNRILSIIRSTGCVQELALSVDGGIQGPRGLCLDESRGRLYVGECSGQRRVLVFDDVMI